MFWLISSCLPALHTLIEYSRGPPSDALASRGSKWGEKAKGGLTSHRLESYSTPEEDRLTRKLGRICRARTRRPRRTSMSSLPCCPVGTSDSVGNIGGRNDEEMADAWFDNDRATACHGRREGWLHAASRNPSRPSIPHCCDGESERTDESKQLMAISRHRLARSIVWPSGRQSTRS